MSNRKPQARTYAGIRSLVKRMPTLYTHFVVTRTADDHYTVLVANNGKVPHNESVGRANKLVLSLVRYHAAVKAGRVKVIRIGHVEFKKRFPAFAKNAGKKK